MATRIVNILAALVLSPVVADIAAAALPPKFAPGEDERNLGGQSGNGGSY